MRSASDKLIRKMKTMKTLLLCCILLTAATARTAAQSIEPRVSEEVELMSALARTAGVCQNAGRGKIPRPADMHYGKRKCHSMAAILVKCSPQPDSAYAPSLPAGT